MNASSALPLKFIQGLIVLIISVLVTNVKFSFVVLSVRLKGFSWRSDVEGGDRAENVTGVANAVP